MCAGAPDATSFDTESLLWWTFWAKSILSVDLLFLTQQRQQQRSYFRLASLTNKAYATYAIIDNAGITLLSMRGCHADIVVVALVRIHVFHIQ